MTRSRLRLLPAGLAVAALAAPASAGAAPGVHVRVEGAKHTLVPDIAVRTNPKRSIGLGTHATCSGGSALGALDAATRGLWGGEYFESLGYQPESILGERHSYAATKDFYTFYVNDKPSNSGLCGYTPKRGDHLLLGVQSAKQTAYPEVIGITAPKRARAGKAFTVKVVAFSAKGKAKALRGATVDAGRDRAKTNRAGRARLTDGHAGPLTIQADKKGLIRSATATVHVKRAAR